jgi:hypothetical protein
LIVKNTPLLSRQSCKNLGSYQARFFYLFGANGDLVWFSHG